MHQHKTHLEQDFELIGDLRRVAIGKALRAIAPLQQKSFSLRRLGKLELERLNLPGGDQRGQLGQFRDGGLQAGLGFISHLVAGGFGSPGDRRPV